VRKPPKRPDTSTRHTREAAQIISDQAFCWQLWHKCRVRFSIIRAMSGKTIKRDHLYRAVYQKVRLSRTECVTLVELVLNEITDCLERGETVKLSRFGAFVVRKKGRRMGRNPKTGEEVPISPRRIVMFKPSPILKQRMNARNSRS
jgi:integration host factor subunit alpha